MICRETNRTASESPYLVTVSVVVGCGATWAMSSDGIVLRDNLIGRNVLGGISLYFCDAATIEDGHDLAHLGIVDTNPPIRPGDLDGNGSVDGRDAALFVRAFASPGDVLARSLSDVNGDCVVDESDVAEYVLIVLGG